jgi:hypothetical protein
MIEIAIKVDKTGKLSMRSNLQDTFLMVGVLELAKKAVMDNQRESPIVVPDIMLKQSKPS